MDDDCDPRPVPLLPAVVTDNYWDQTNIALLLMVLRFLYNTILAGRHLCIICLIPDNGNNNGPVNQSVPRLGREITRTCFALHFIKFRHEVMTHSKLSVFMFMTL